MPDLDDLIELAEDFGDWLDMFANELVLGLIVALCLVIWITRGREPPVRPA